MGSHTLRFLMAPLVHWPEVMVTYDVEHKILFSADAFGNFGALNGNLYADEVDFKKDWLTKHAATISTLSVVTDETFKTYSRNSIP